MPDTSFRSPSAFPDDLTVTPIMLTLPRPVARADVDQAEDTREHLAPHCDLSELDDSVAGVAHQPRAGLDPLRRAPRSAFKRAPIAELNYPPIHKILFEGGVVFRALVPLQDHPQTPGFGFTGLLDPFSPERREGVAHLE